MHSRMEVEAVWGLNRSLLETIETDMPREFMATYEGDVLLYPEFVERLYQLTVSGGDRLPGANIQ